MQVSQLANVEQMANVEFPAVFTEGGDDRLVLNAKGVNKYHCRPEVRPLLSLVGIPGVVGLIALEGLLVV